MSRWAGRLISKTPAVPAGPGETAAAPGMWTLPEVAYWSKQGRWPTVGSDPYWSYVSYLLGTTATNAAQNKTFLDSSANNFTITRVGNTTQGSFTPYGSLWSNYFDGSGDYLSTPNSTGFQFGTGDFTVECWVNKPAAANGSIVDVRATGGAEPWAFYIDGSNFPYFYDGTVYTSSVAITNNQWNHIAVVRTSGVLKIFVNGVQGYSAAYTVSLNATGTLLIGGTAAYTTGYISNLRIVKGTAVYTSAFTPPGAPLTAISGTSLLTCQSNRFIDNSVNNFTFTVNGDTRTLSFSPFILAPPGYSSSINGGSGYLDGSGDYLTAPANAAYAFGTGDFTVECWLYQFSTSAGGRITTRLSGGGASGTWGFNFSTTTFAFTEVIAGEPGVTASGLPPMVNTWTHLVACRSGSTLRLFANGVLVGSGTNTTNFNNSSYQLGIGASYENVMTGYITDVRIVKGAALYTAAFTPPAAPLTAVSGTSLLLNCTNAGIFDAAMKNDMETVGTAQVSNTQAKYGTTSAYFSSASSYLNAPFSQNAAFGTGDFTVEAWIYSVATTAGYTCVFSSRDGIASNANAVFFGLKPTTNQMTFYTSSEIIGTTTAVSTGAWTHVALVRSSGTATIYINGTSAGTASFTTSLTGTGLSIGNEYNAASSNGGLYVDDVRITKGYARYTGNFTAPTAALPVY